MNKDKNEKRYQSQLEEPVLQRNLPRKRVVGTGETVKVRNHDFELNHNYNITDFYREFFS